ncbi:MAG: peptidylprolyl isomerase [Candidatus Diapherotrites archaeon]|nr:peptidylprolyl isomerase [Candidatus Diapherotrites archaeon]
MKAEKAAFAALLLALLLSGCTQPGQGGNGGGDMSNVVVAGDTVNVDYKGTLQDGAVFDSSLDRGEPYTFVVGATQWPDKAIDGFDEAVRGMKLNEEKTVTIPPEKAYGAYDEKKIVEIPKSNFSEPEKLVVGMPVGVPGGGPQGEIKEIKDSTVVVDFNHKYAGKTLTFWIKVVKIEKA